MVTKNKLWSLQYREQYPIYADFSRKLDELFQKSGSADFDKWLQKNWLEYCQFMIKNAEAQIKFFDYITKQTSNAAGEGEEAVKTDEGKPAEASKEAGTPAPVKVEKIDTTPKKLTKNQIIIGATVLIVAGIIVYQNSQKKS